MNESKDNPGELPEVKQAVPGTSEQASEQAGAPPADPPRTDVVEAPPLPTMPKQRSVFREMLSFVGFLFVAFLVAFVMITFVFRSYQVDGPSMQQTLQNADKLIIWKVPRTWARLTRHAFIPKRGDIVVFNESGLSQFGQEDSKQLIKRVIGLPGDRVVVHNGKITIYNQQNPKGFNPDTKLTYYKNISSTSGEIDIVLGKNQLFVFGDNRPDSLDSRAFGPINANQIVGKLVLRYYPVNKSEVF